MVVIGYVDFFDMYWMGIIGGGVWKMDDVGYSWYNIFDGFFGGLIGVIDVVDLDLNVFYVGIGLVDICGNILIGCGMWKIIDGGEMWSFFGLFEVGQIGLIEVDLYDLNLVYVVVFGYLFGFNEECGFYCSCDGGLNWECVLFVLECIGVMDVQINQCNLCEFWVLMWIVECKFWMMISGFEEGGIWCLIDGGDSWIELMVDGFDNGFLDGVVGKIGFVILLVDLKWVWVLIEVIDLYGGIYCIDDSGKLWECVNWQCEVCQCVWYYIYFIVSIMDCDMVWVFNMCVYCLIDVGKMFEMIQVFYGDVYDFWINFVDFDCMVVVNDGGGQVMVNGGCFWLIYYNQLIVEFYDVDVDNVFLYVFYGGQQDNIGIGVFVWMDLNVLYFKMVWVNFGGCEIGLIVVDLYCFGVIYGGCYGGDILCVEQVIGEFCGIFVYLQLQFGVVGKDFKYCF